MLANDQAIKWAKGRSICVYADSVLCLGKMEQGSGAAEKWKGKLEDIEMYSPYQDAEGIDGEAIELEWKNFPIFSILSILQEIQKDRRTSNPRNSKTESSSCQCSTTSCGHQMIGIASQTPRVSRITRTSSFQDTGRFLVKAQRRDGTEILTNSRDSGISQPTRWYNNTKETAIAEEDMDVVRFSTIANHCERQIVSMR